MNSSIRRTAVSDISNATPVAGHVDYISKPVQTVYGEHVFNESVQRARLPKAVFKTLQKTIKAGEPLDPSIADAVAVAMKIGRAHV